VAEALQKPFMLGDFVAAGWARRGAMEAMAHPGPTRYRGTVHDGAMIPFFQGSLDQVKELQGLCASRGLPTTPLEPPGGSKG
jgi:hypothetical protein